MEEEISPELLNFFDELFNGAISFKQVVFLAQCLFILVVTLLLFFIASQIILKKFEKSRTAKYINKLPLFSDVRNLLASAQEKFLLTDITMKSIALGAKIDSHTNRRNNSKNVSSLVYEISSRLNLEQKECIMNSCAAMTYDAGFLSIDSSLFHAEILSAREKNLLRRHVQPVYSSFDFAGKENWDLFVGAALFHHENFDGTGYPEGLSGKDIPLVARIIRIAESYVSLTSKRSHRKILSKSEALEELEHNSRMYDSELFAILKDIVESK